MNIEFKNNKRELTMEDIPSGALVEYHSDGFNDSSLGIVVRNQDDENTIIFDLERNEYYDDTENYVISKVYDDKDYKIVVDNGED